jgi:hypothetical protein
MLKNLLFFSILLHSTGLIAQDVGGAWFGKADIMKEGVHNNYLAELILKQKGNEVEGIFGYYFKDTYQSFFVRGTYNKQTRQVVIKNLPILFYGNECSMHFYGTLLVSKVKNTIKGAFQSDSKYKYTCPEIRVSMAMNEAENRDSLLKEGIADKKFWKPQQEDFVVKEAASSKPVTIPADASNTEVAAPAQLPDETQQKLIAEFKERKNSYTRILDIDGDSVRVSLYDNGDIDGDSISVFLNNSPVLAKHVLNDRALNIYLTLDSTKDINELSMFAENLGRIPPNTALMVITDGINRYEMYLSSSMTQNATVRLRKRK